MDRGEFTHKLIRFLMTAFLALVAIMLGRKASVSGASCGTCREKGNCTLTACSNYETYERKK